MFVSIDLNVTLPNRDCDVKVNINKVYLNELQATPEDVILKVSKVSGVPYAKLIKPQITKQSREIAFPRAICAVLIKEIWPYITPTAIGRLLNIHSSTFYTYQSNHESYLQYADYKDVYEKCRNFVIFEK
jgi:chromosomal replication initiation ATPase DnaA